MDYKTVTNCRVCNSSRLKKYLDLGEVPLANSLLNSPNDKVKLYPIRVLFCEDCSLSQLSIVVNPEIMFTNYPYHSSISNTFQQHCRDMAKEVKDILRKTNNFNIQMSAIIDIASNDGCLLEQFREKGFEWLVGIEPSKNLSDECTRKGFQMYNEFWETVEVCPKGVCITATNVLAHVNNVEKFIERIYFHLDKYRGISIIEVPYVYDLIKNNAFDTIYHEHLSYFTFKSLKLLIEKMNLVVFKVERKNIHGGSLRLYICPRNYVKGLFNPDGTKYDGKKIASVQAIPVFCDYSEYHPVEPSVNELLEFEKANDLYDFSTYENFSRQVRKSMDGLVCLLETLKSEGRKVMAYGAAAKGISLLNYCGITSRLISHIVDDTPAKQGKWTPDSKIPIVKYSMLESICPDYLVILPWNFSEEIMDKTRNIGAKYIIPKSEPNNDFEFYWNLE